MAVRVMVVDDHPMWRDGVARDLTDAGYLVAAAMKSSAPARRRRPDGGRCRLTSRGARWFGALLGLMIGAAAAADRWRIAAAVTLTMGTATCLFIAFSATNGQPEKLVEQHRVISAVLMIVLVTAAATAVVGATAPVLATHGAVPAVLGPITGVRRRCRLRAASAGGRDPV